MEIKQRSSLDRYAASYKAAYDSYIATNHHKEEAHVYATEYANFYISYPRTIK